MSSVSNVSFYERVEDALQSSGLHIALDRATSRFTTLRANALASLPDADAVRDRARLIRAHTLSRLDDYLSQFADAVEAAGGRVHWAADAAAANRAVVEIARSHNARLIVKGKSMISEEIHLNHALEATGATVVESDLGEYIIQLAHETPSHIIVPAVHKTKEQIGQLFHEKLGLPYTAEPAQMTAAARAKLRQVFLTADLGITGVNFGVAETGTLCIVTNEGNGRLSSSAPRVHIALMGMERLAPTLADLSVMLQVLARSATGQKLTVYTNLLTGPRRAAEPDGPDELHIVIVDNGRSRVLASEAAEILYCIRCGACLNACPVYREIGGHAYGSVYPGPVGAVLTPALYGVAPWSDLPHASTLCGACRDVCPVRIDIPRMLLELRDEGRRAGKLPLWLTLGLRLYRLVAVRPALFRAAIKFSSWATRLLAVNDPSPTKSTEGRPPIGLVGGWIKQLPPPLSGWTQHRDFPTFAARPFSEQFKDRKTKPRLYN